MLGGYNDRNIAGRHTKSQHAYGNAVDIDSTGRNIITPDFAKWAQEHDKQLRAAESRWGIRAGRDWANPDMGHWEWGGGAGSGGSSPRRFGHPHVRGHHPATIGAQQHSMIIEDHTGGMVHISSSDSGINFNQNIKKEREYFTNPFHSIPPGSPEMPKSLVPPPERQFPRGPGNLRIADLSDRENSNSRNREKWGTWYNPIPRGTPNSLVPEPDRSWPPFGQNRGTG